MTRYTPSRDGEPVLITMPAIWHRSEDDGVSYFSTDRGGSKIFIPVAAVTDVQPVPRPLPTKEGAVILASNARHWGESPLMLRIERVDDRAQPRYGELVWVICGAGDWIDDPEDINPNWVEIDPKTLRPKEEA